MVFSWEYKLRLCDEHLAQRIWCTENVCNPAKNDRRLFNREQASSLPKESGLSTFAVNFVFVTIKEEAMVYLPDYLNHYLGCHFNIIWKYL